MRLALSLEAEVLLIDERAGFQVANALGIRTLGLLGVLLEAKNQQLIPKVRPLLDCLREEIGFWVKESLYLKVLVLAGEQSLIA